MSSATISLVIAIVGVCGTLASAIFTQQLSQRAKLQELARADRLRLAEQETAEKQRKTDQLRSCYVQLNANDRNYRDAMLAYAYALKAGSPGEAEAAEMATARRAQRDARAEAQMIVSEEVLDTEGRVNRQLTLAYSRLQQIQRESDARVREALLEEVIKLLDGIISLLSRARVIMRMELGVIDKPPAWYQPEPDVTQVRLAQNAPSAGPSSEKPADLPDVHHHPRVPAPASPESPAAAAALRANALPCSGGERKMLELAVSLADHHPVILGDAVSGLDDRSTQIVTRAVLHASGKRSSHDPARK